MIDKIINLVQNVDLVLWVSVLLGISEALALIPSLKSNSILTFVVNSLKWVIEKLKWQR